MVYICKLVNIISRTQVQVLTHTRADDAHILTVHTITSSYLVSTGALKEK